MPRPDNTCPVCRRTTRRVDPCHRVNTLSTEHLAGRHEDPLWRCEGCGFWWIDPAPNLQALADGYRETEVGHWGAPGAAKSLVARDLTGKVARVVSRVPGGRALDVGCFHGDLLAALPDSFERVGIELSRSASEMARSRGITVVEGDAMSAAPQGLFDVVFCMDTIEHIESQRAFAERLASWLAPDGLLVIETGDTDCPMARFMGPRWSYMSLVEHVCAHSRRSLNQLMSQVGLSPVHTERRFHTRPAARYTPLQRTLLAAAFRGVTGTLDLVHRVVQLPAPLERLRTRFAPWHATTDHLLAFYSPIASRLLATEARAP